MKQCYTFYTTEGNKCCVYLVDFQGFNLASVSHMRTPAKVDERTTPNTHTHTHTRLTRCTGMELVKGDR